MERVLTIRAFLIFDLRDEELSTEANEENEGS